VAAYAVAGARRHDRAGPNRADLTAHERNNTLATLAEAAKQVLQEQVETCSDSEQVSKPARGPSRSAGSLRDVAERIGVPVTNIVKAQQHVETVEAHPDLGGPDWKQYHVLEARRERGGPGDPSLRSG